MTRKVRSSKSPFRGLFSFQHDGSVDGLHTTLRNQPDDPVTSLPFLTCIGTLVIMDGIINGRSYLMMSAQFLNQAILALHTPISNSYATTASSRRGLRETQADELSVRSNDVIRCITSGT